jgi:hypothetical protein
MLTLLKSVIFGRLWSLCIRSKTTLLMESTLDDFCIIFAHNLLLCFMITISTVHLHNLQENANVLTTSATGMLSSRHLPVAFSSPPL